MTPATSWTLVSIVLGLGYLLIAGLCRVSGRCSDAEREMEAEMHRHTCSVCGRVQRLREPIEQWSPCVACQVRDLRRPLEIDLDDFADADAIRVYLDGHDRLPSHSALDSHQAGAHY